ncbi:MULTISPECIES: hypothetical protein [Vibrio]|uniref:HNH domain-containing protein n=1 Tax=Vibrio atlanticus TaxID=693153 RepID=A0ABV4KUQ2_9VIBR
MFFPGLVRKSEEHYYSQRGGFYASYGDNYDNIEKDCKSRCVYCDITRMENGGDPLSLDHFRPKKVFAKKFTITAIHPYNLHLSCQKCNVLKSSDWHGCCDTTDGPTYSNNVGYIDRFVEDIHEYITVDKGVLVPLKHPAQYMIKKMLLNRPNRIYYRYLRQLRQTKQDINVRLTDLMVLTSEEMRGGLISFEEASKRMEIFSLAQSILTDTKM